MKSSEKNIPEIREFQGIRRYLSLIYLYGLFGGEDFERANRGSIKDYNKMLALIRQLFPSQDDVHSKRSIHFFRRSYQRSGINVLSKAYMFRSLNLGKMIEYLAILSRLQEGPACSTELVDTVDRVSTKSWDEKTVTARCQTLIDFGVVKKERSTLSLQPDPTDVLSAEQLQQLAEYARFSSSVTYPRIAGSFLTRTLERKLYAQGVELPQTPAFLLRHNSYHNCLDEELVYQLLPLLEAHRYVMFDDRKRLPIKIRVDTRLGRWYVLCLNEEKRSCVEKITNVKHIEGIEVAEDKEWNNACKQVEKDYANSLFSSKVSEPILVRAKLEFPANSGIYKQFLREITIGRVDGDCYEALVTDPLELKPLLRAYGPYLRLLTQEQTLKRELAEDYEKMLRALETEEPA